MRICVVGSSPRENALAALCRERGHETPSIGPWDQVALPLPVSNMPEELESYLPRGQKIICGKTNAHLEAMAARRGWNLRNVLLDEAFQLENASLTAEGALWAAMSRSDAALHGSRCLVIGYGRIGKALTDMLRGIGAKVTVAARREESRAAAGSGSISIGDIPEVLPAQQFVFNTVPSPILPDSALRLLRFDALLLELASPPYGFDLNAARKLGLNAHLESGLPGRCFPKSAAQALLRFMEREANQDE